MHSQNTFARDHSSAARPKVLAISYLFPNAVMPNHGIFVFNRLHALSRYADIKVINPIPYSPVHGFLGQYRQYADIPIRTTRGALEIFHPRFFSIPKFFKSIEIRTYYHAVKGVLAEELKDFDFDLIDLHWTFPDLPTGYQLAQHYAKPLLVTLRGMEAFHSQDGDVRESTVAKYLPSADRIISLSEELQQQSLALVSDASKHSIIRNGVDTDCFYYISRQQARASLGISDDERFILMVGALIRRKGIDLVIEALAALRRSYPGVKLRVVGSEGHEGNFRSELNGMINIYGLEDAVIFEGAVDNDRLNYWYSAADVFCLASRGEGSPNVLTEALACGCPAVASDVGSVAEIMASEQGLGVVVRPEDPKALQQGLAQVFDMDCDRQRLASTMAKYNWDWCANKVNSVYASLLVHPH